MGAIVDICGKKTDDMLSVKEAAVMLGAGISTVNRYVATGKIKACKIKGSKAHYIRVDDLNDFEQNGSLRTRNRKPKVKKPETSIEILETMNETQLQALLAAVASVTKLLAMDLNGAQLGMAKSTLNELINGDKLLFHILEQAPELLEVSA